MWNHFWAKKLSRATHNFHMRVWWIFNWPVNKDSSSSKRNSASQKVCQPARCSPHGASTGIGNFRWASGPAQNIWCVRHGPKPSLKDEETGSLWGHGTSHRLLVSRWGVGPRPASPSHWCWPFAYSNMIPSGYPEIIVQIPCIFTAFSGAHNHPCWEMIFKAELKSPLPHFLLSMCSIFPKEASVAILSLIIFSSQIMAPLSPQLSLLQVNHCSSFHFFH